MRRLLLIARREYAAYTRTVGFWLSLIIVPTFMVLGSQVPTLLKDAAPTRAVAIADFTATGDRLQAPGAGPGAAMARSIEETYRQRQITALASAAVGEGGPAGAARVGATAAKDGPEAGMAALRQVAPQAAAKYQQPHPPLRLAPPPPEVSAATGPDAAEAAARRFVAGQTSKAPALDAIAVLRLKGGQPVAHLWTVRVADDVSAAAIKDALGEVQRNARLAAAGLDPATLKAIEGAKPEVQVLSPRSASGAAVTLRDRLPTYVGFGAGFLLWSLVMTAAGILLNSVMEEKSNRVLEVLLSSADTMEIIAGKVLGVAGIALTVVTVWLSLGLGFLSTRVPGVFDMLAPILADAPFWGLTALYFLGGYLMYGVLFAAVGAFCETPRDAQTLLGPMMMVLMIPLFVMQVALRAPEMPLFRILSWVPFFSPFLMPGRIAAHPPMLEVAATLVGMGLLAAIMVWIGGRAFRAGALSTGKVGMKGLIAALRGQG
jgi:ABC-2 type transport system permease protein